MTELPYADRRTVLQTISATAIGGSLVAGTASAGQIRAHRAVRDESEIEIVAEHDHDANEHRFDFSTTEVPSGWVTLTFDNRTDHTHFVDLFKLPQAAIAAAAEADEDLLDYYDEHVVGPFQYLMDDIAPEKEPDPDDLSDVYSDEETLFPPWIDGVLASGGVGLTSPHMTSRTTVELEPGEYYTECYVKDEDEEFHAYNGMADIITVTDERAGTEPEATVEVSLSTVETGTDDELRASMDVDQDVRAGEQTVAVRFEDQQLYEHDGGHDVHLIRLDADTTIDDVNRWMNWMEPGGLVSDGTEPGTFLGGAYDVIRPELLERAGNAGENGGGAAKTSYFEVTLNPGAYALVSEVPNPAEKGLLETFTVPFDE